MQERASTRTRRGGRRPGAGAPKGNVNGIKTGRYSHRFFAAALMIAAVPELRVFFEAIQRESDRLQREAYLKLIAEAVQTTISDPNLAKICRCVDTRRRLSGSSPAARSDRARSPG